jgi:hypothetical protein
MNLKILSLFIFFIFSSLTVAQKEKSLKFFGDVRFRTEMERDLQNNYGNKLSGNDKLLLSFRLGIKYKYNENWQLGARVRTGNPDMPQSSDIAIGNNFTGKGLSLDKAYIKFKKSGFYVNLGKTGMNIWEPDQILWDIDINPEGIGIGKKLYLYEMGKISLKTGYYITGNNSKIYDRQSFKQYNYLAVAQIKYNYATAGHQFILAPVYINAKIPEQNNKMLNYQILTTYFQYTFRRKLKLNFDYFHNFENLENKVDRLWQTEKNGFLVSAEYNFFYRKLFIKFSYAGIQKYAVIDRFAQNDWVSLKNKDLSGIYYTSGSNFGGFALSLTYRINKKINTGLHFWKVKSLQQASYEKTPETGTRIRFDISMKF